MRDLDPIMLEKRIAELEKKIGTADYDNLTNKPKINKVTLEGDVSLLDLDIQPQKPKLRTERVIGKWYNGKTLYETIYDVNITLNTNMQTWNVFPTQCAPDADRIVECEAYTGDVNSFGSVYKLNEIDISNGQMRALPSTSHGRHIGLIRTVYTKKNK